MCAPATGRTPPRLLWRARNCSPPRANAVRQGRRWDEPTLEPAHWQCGAADDSNAVGSHQWTPLFISPLAYVYATPHSIYNYSRMRARSSVGRAREWHSRGRRFDPDRVHQTEIAENPHAEVPVGGIGGVLALKPSGGKPCDRLSQKCLRRPLHNPSFRRKPESRGIGIRRRHCPNRAIRQFSLPLSRPPSIKGKVFRKVPSRREEPRTSLHAMAYWLPIIASLSRAPPNFGEMSCLRGVECIRTLQVHPREWSFRAATVRLHYEEIGSE